jgi:hypothetical protein
MLGLTAGVFRWLRQPTAFCLAQRRSANPALALFLSVTRAGNIKRIERILERQRVASFMVAVAVRWRTPNLCLRHWQELKNED